MSGDFASQKKNVSWVHFSLLPGEKVKCNLCHNRYSYKGGSMGNLRKHYRIEHPWVLIDETSTNIRQRATLPVQQEQIVDDGPQPATSTHHSASKKAEVKINGTRMRPQILSADVSRPIKLSRHHKLDDLILSMIVKDLQPFSIVHDKGFLDLLWEFEPSYKPPCKNTFVSPLLEDKYELNKNILKSLLEDTEFVTLTTDAWTSSANDGYISVTAHFITTKWELISCLLSCFSYNENHTAVNLCQQIKNIVNEFEISEKILAIVTDNAANIVASVGLTNWVHIPCLAHTLNFIVQHGLSLIKEIRDKVKAIVEYFHRNSQAHSKLLSTQTKIDANCVPLKLKNNVCTRWDSTFFMFERILQLQEPLTVTLGLLHHPVQLLSENEWKMLQEICKVLQPFEQISTKIGGEAFVTISEVIVIVRGLTSILHRYQTEMLEDTSKRLIADFLTSISKRFSNIDYNTFYSKASLLDPRFKRAAFLNEDAYKKAKEKLQNEAIAQLTKKRENCMTSNFDQPANVVEENIISADSINLVWQEFERSVALNIQETSPTATAIAEISMYLEEPNISRHEDPQAWWKTRELLYPTISTLAKKHLCIVSTSAPVSSKSVFSKTGQIFTQRRNRLKAKHVNKLLFLNFNNFLFNYKK